MNVHSKLWLPGAVLCALALGACEAEKPPGMVGTLERDRIELAFETSEPILAIHVQDGIHVTAGTLLMEQDPERMRIRLARLEAEYELSAARLAELERGPREESIREARAVLESAQAETVNARADLERTRSVFEQGLSTRAQLDHGETRLATAEAHEKARRESLDALLHGTTAEELQQAAAAVRAAQAAVDDARLALQRTRLEAPVNGQLEKILGRLGERPLAGQPVALMLNDARTYARVYVPESLKSQVTPGRTLEVRIDGQDRAFTGTVRWISADASFTPYFALTEHDRSRLSYVAEIDLAAAAELPVGLPLVATPPGGATNPE